jgi:hypothetical protein
MMMEIQATGESGDRIGAGLDARLAFPLGGAWAQHDHQEGTQQGDKDDQQAPGEALFDGQIPAAQEEERQQGHPNQAGSKEEADYIWSGKHAKMIV